MKLDIYKLYLYQKHPQICGFPFPIEFEIVELKTKIDISSNLSMFIDFYYIT